MLKNSFLCGLGLMLVFAFAGCGYTTSSIIYKGAKTVSVKDFVNKIKVSQEVTDRRMYVAYRSGMELDITREVINRFVIDGNLNVVPLREADLIVEGELIDFKKEALMLDSADNVLEFRLLVQVNLKLYYAKTNKVILEKQGFTGQANYKVSGALSTSEDQAIQLAIKDLSTRIVDIVVEGW